MQLQTLCRKLHIVFLVLLIPQIIFAGRVKRKVVFQTDDNRVLSNCLTPDGHRGQCLLLTSCRWLMQTVSRKTLYQYFCGFEGEEPMVCCKASIIHTLDLDSTDKPTKTTTKLTTTTTTGRPPVNMTIRIEKESRIAGSKVPETTDLLVNTRMNYKPSFLPQECGKRYVLSTRIVNGLPAQPGAWPWMAVIFVRRASGALAPDCGGTLVTRSHVVTAAHCLVEGKKKDISPSRIIIRLGAHDLSILNEPEAVDIGVEDVRIHPQFERNGTYKNDIAVLKLSRPVTFTNFIAPACLPYDNLREVDLTDYNAFVTGFGTTSFNGKASDVLLETTFPVVPQEICNKKYKKLLKTNISNVYICAGGGNTDACQGDSGGPLLALPEGLEKRYYLIGVVSFGKECAKPGYPGVYTRVTEFLDWLEEKLSD